MSNGLNAPSGESAKKKAISTTFMIQGVVGAVLILGAIFCFMNGQVGLGILLIGVEVVFSIVAVLWIQHVQRRSRNGE